MAPIVLFEIARAAVAMPLAFVQEPGGRFILVAVLVRAGPQHAGRP